MNGNFLVVFALCVLGQNSAIVFATAVVVDGGSCQAPGYNGIGNTPFIINDYDLSCNDGCGPTYTQVSTNVGPCGSSALPSVTVLYSPNNYPSPCNPNYPNYPYNYPNYPNNPYCPNYPNYPGCYGYPSFAPTPIYPNYSPYPASVGCSGYFAYPPFPSPPPSGYPVYPYPGGYSPCMY